MPRACVLLLLTAAVPLFGQSGQGEIRFSVVDGSGRPITASIEISGAGGSIHKTLSTAANGQLFVHPLPFGLYRYVAQRPHFQAQRGVVAVESSVPVAVHVALGVGTVETVVNVTGAVSLVDPHEAGVVDVIGAKAVSERTATEPGRSLPDLLAAQPGWILEANGVLHPRGSEYQVQYIVDGLPLIDNRSPSFAPPFDTDNIQTLLVLTGSYPAEFGRKLGGVIEVTTTPDARQGLHGNAVIGGGSFGTATGSASLEYGAGKNFFDLDLDGARTGRYLDPPVEQNFTNTATTSGVSAKFQRDLNDSDRLSFAYQHGEARFEVPNEIAQQGTGQRQDRTSVSSEAQIRYQHILSANTLLSVRGSYEDLGARLWSNPLSIPVAAAQDRGFRQGYAAASLAGESGRNNWKAGVDAVYGSVHEVFSDSLTQPDFFSPGTPAQFAFRGTGLDRELAGFAQNDYRRGNWTLSGGLRWDSYHFLVARQAVSPRLGMAYYSPRTKLLAHASYDRVFQTPATENLLLASSPAVASLNPQTLRLAVQPSSGNFYEVGVSRAMWGRVKLDVSLFRRDLTNFADDDVLLNTGVSFPIAFASAEIHGVEVRADMPVWGRFLASLSYSNQAGTGFLPVTGGLFFGGEASSLLEGRSSFPISQDQRNTAAARLRYQLTKNFWVASSALYGSGLPVEVDPSDIPALAGEYSQQILNRVNFSRGRVRPSFSLDFSGGATIWRHENRSVELQGGVVNVTNRLNVIDFAGLFSGTALGEPRSASVRLSFAF